MKQTALITGASSGIGLELAKIHAQQGNNLILIARREEELLNLKRQLEDNYDTKVYVIVKDLSINEAPEEVYQEVTSNNFNIDFLINNAGFGGYGKFHKRDWQTDENMIDLNVKALSALCRFFLPGMVKRNRGKILNVASTAAFIPGPLMAIYYASKSFVVSLSQALAEELSDTNVTVTALCPGPVRTEFAATADIEKSDLFKKAATAESVAKLGYKAMMRGKLIAINDIGLRFLLTCIIPFTPKKMVLKMSRKLVEMQ